MPRLRGLPRFCGMTGRRRLRDAGPGDERQGDDPADEKTNDVFHALLSCLRVDGRMGPGPRDAAVNAL
jgi:hypothetical protein